MSMFTPEYLDALVKVEAAKQKAAWSKYASDFNAMTDHEVEYERKRSQDLVDEQEEWLEAVAAWEAAGKPRDKA